MPVKVKSPMDAIPSNLPRDRDRPGEGGPAGGGSSPGEPGPGESHGEPGVTRIMFFS